MPFGSKLGCLRRDAIADQHRLRADEAVRQIERRDEIEERAAAAGLLCQQKRDVFAAVGVQVASHFVAEVARDDSRRRARRGRRFGATVDEANRLAADRVLDIHVIRARVVAALPAGGVLAGSPGRSPQDARHAALAATSKAAAVFMRSVVPGAMIRRGSVRAERRP